MICAKRKLTDSPKAWPACDCGTTAIDTIDSVALPRYLLPSSPFQQCRRLRRLPLPPLPPAQSRAIGCAAGEKIELRHAKPFAIAIGLMAATPSQAADWAIALHGGAGVIERANTSPDDDAAIRAALASALESGTAILKSGGTAVDAVDATVQSLEASPWFNAGVGAVFTSAGTIELDAAIMDGKSLAAGAVTGAMTTQSPIALARRLMEKGPHVFLSGAAADSFAKANSLPQVPNSHFMTERRKRQLDMLLASGPTAAFDAEVRFGTVGAVARDTAGNLAAATSTGGLTGKAPGRIGDAPVIGAGTLADNRGCAVSATGSGEIFIRARVASLICDRMRFGGASLADASAAAIAEMGALGGSGGIIAVGPVGDPHFAMNSLGMYRALATRAGKRAIAIYADE